MSITQTYFLAHTARGKLSTEAARGDHNLRLLVGHANLLDSLTVELKEAEREQEAWFEKTVQASKRSSQQEVPKSRRVHWRDAPAVEDDDGDIDIPDASDEDSDDSGDEAFDESIQEAVSVKVSPRGPASTQSTRRRAKSPPPAPNTFMIDTPAEDEETDEDVYEDEDEDNVQLALVRTHSHSSSSPSSPSHPPELVSDTSSEEDTDEEEEQPARKPAIPNLSLAREGIKASDFAKPLVADAVDIRPAIAAF